MLSRAAYDLAKAGLTLVLRLWPLWLFWIALQGSTALWREVVLLGDGMDRASLEYRLAYALWPTAGLFGPILLMLVATGLHGKQLASRTTAFAAIAGVALALGLTLWPLRDYLAPLVGQVPPVALLGSIPGAYLVAFAVGILAIGGGVHILRGGQIGHAGGAALERARSDNHGHADWLSLKEARRLFPGPDPAYGGIVVGEAYRVDQDRATRQWGRTGCRPFDPDDRTTWGAGGTTPLLIDPCRTGPTHALVLAGSGGFKTTSVGVPTLLTWTGSAVVLDPSREIGPMVAGYRERKLGQRVVTLDPAGPGGGAFNALDWIDPASPLAEANVEAVATWLAGEPARGQSRSGSEFFRDMGKSLIACLLADLLWDEELARPEKTLKRLRQALVTPEAEMRKRLEAVHARSASPLARDLAGTLMGLVPETFSGVYANANQATRWLSTSAYADLVSGSTFETRELCNGDLTVFVQIPLKVLQATPGLGRVVIGALLNAAYEADGHVEGRILFLLDEVARLGPMDVIEAARDAGRKYGLTLLLLYQSVGQLIEQWGREGARAWYDSTSWRLYAAVQDPETARELSQACGEHGVMATSEGDTRGTSGRLGGGLAASSSGQSATRSEIRRSLIKPDELLQDTRADEAFIIIRGSRPLRCGRAIYFRRPEMAAAVAPSRFHGRGRHAAE